jgi:hypothetical protein
MGRYDVAPPTSVVFWRQSSWSEQCGEAKADGDGKMAATGRRGLGARGRSQEATRNPTNRPRPLHWAGRQRQTGGGGAERGDCWRAHAGRSPLVPATPTSTSIFLSRCRRGTGMPDLTPDGLSTVHYTRFRCKCKSWIGPSANAGQRASMQMMQCSLLCHPIRLAYKAVLFRSTNNQYF